MRLSEVVHRVILTVTSVGGLVFVIVGVVAMVDGWNDDSGRMFDDGFEYAGFGLVMLSLAAIHGLIHRRLAERET